MHTDIYPGLDRTTGFTDGYTDVGIDASFVDTLANTDVLTINGRLIHERQSLAATCTLAGGDQTCFSNKLDDVHVDASYYWPRQDWFRRRRVRHHRLGQRDPLCRQSHDAAR